MILVIFAKQYTDNVGKQIAAFEEYVTPKPTKIMVVNNRIKRPENLPPEIIHRTMPNSVGVGKWAFTQGSIKILHAEQGSFKDMLFVHNDIFPIQPIQFGDKLECSRGFSYQYLWVPKRSSLPDLKGEIWNVASITVEKPLPDSIFYDLFPNEEKTSLFYFERGFLHFNGLDFGPEVEWKRKLVEKLYNTPLSKNIISMALRYKKERDIWVEAGKPLRTPEQIEEIFEVCKACPFFDTGGSDSQGNCGICGCFIKKQGTTLNKAAWATTKCPHKPPKWGI